MNKSRHLAARFEEAVARLGGDESLLREMAAITSADLPDVIKETQAALQVADEAAAASGLHKLKGMLSTFDTRGVTIEIHEMLDLARSQELAEAQKKFVRHKTELDALVNEISSIAVQ